MLKVPNFFNLSVGEPTVTQDSEKNKKTRKSIFYWIPQLKWEKK